MGFTIDIKVCLVSYRRASTLGLLLGCGLVRPSLAADNESSVIEAPAINIALASEPVVAEVPAHANQAVPQGLTLDQLEAMALQCHPSLLRARALVEAARGRAFQVGLGPNPEFGFEGQQLASDGRAEQYGWFLGQRIVVKDKLRLNREAVLHEVRNLEQQLSAQQLRVLTDVRIAFYRVLRAEKEVEANRELFELSQQAVALSSALFEAKEVSKIDVLQASIESQATQLQLKNANNRYQAAWQSLTAVSNLTQLLPQPLLGDLFDKTLELDFEAELARLESQSPELYAIIAQIDQARTQLRRDLIEIRPDVTVQGLVNWRDNGTDGDPNAGLLVSVPIPWKNRNQGAIAESRWLLAASQHQLDQKQLELRQRLAIAYERYSNANNQAEVYRTEILPKAEETLQATRLAYQAGEISFINFLTIQRTYIQSRLLFLDAAEGIRLAEEEIRGLLLSDNLSQP